MTVPASIPAGDLLTAHDLSVWVRETLDPADEFVTRTISAASLVVRDAAGMPGWTYDTAPERARLIATQLAKRTYLNPDAVVRSSVGPLSESTVEDFARTLELTPYEIQQLQLVAGTAPSEGGEIFLLNMGSPALVIEETIYTRDMAGTLFPMYQAGEVGSP